MGLVIAITGPTAVGKSRLALEWAAATGGEIVSADSRQIYRELDVGTAKPTQADLARVPHHFVSERSVHDPPFTAGRFARAAEDRIDDIRSRGVAPVVVGGSMLYLDALVDGIADIPPLPGDLRALLSAEAATAEGRAALFGELQAADPAAAATLDPSKSHRLVRLVGVLRAFGPPSDGWRRAPPPRHAFRLVVLDLPRDELYERIHDRIDAMLAGGLVDETARLLDAGVVLDRGPLHTIGYAEPAAFLRGEIDHDEMVRLLRRNTRRFAKRQWTWLRRRPDALWVSAHEASVDWLGEKTRTAVG